MLFQKLSFMSQLFLNSVAQMIRYLQQPKTERFDPFLTAIIIYFLRKYVDTNAADTILLYHDVFLRYGITLHVFEYNS